MGRSNRLPHLVPAALAFTLTAAPVVSPADDLLLKAMRDEMARSRTLMVASLEKPYFISYELDDSETLSISGTLNGIVRSNRARFRAPRVQVRVGDYRFDNTNYVGSGVLFGTRYNLEGFPLENAYPVLRRYLWLATDQTYKSAVEAIARKRAALKNVAAVEDIPDFAPAQPAKVITDIPADRIDEEPWLARVRELSGVFAHYPEIRGSGVEFEAVRNTHYLMTSEGAEVRVPERVALVRAVAAGQAPDGMIVRDSVTFQSLDLNSMPLEPEMRRAMESLAANVTALARAPAGESYNGPVLFEGVAAAQIFAEVLGRNLALTRKPVMEPGRPGAMPESELEGRQGSRILPEWMDVVDDPTQSQWRGRPLFGHYLVDLEGLKPAPLHMVEKGVLKNFFLTRQPVRGFAGSNGRARLPGNFGANMAGLSNLFVSARQTVSASELKRKLIQLCQSRGKPWGVLVRRMDFPSSASMEEARRLLNASAQGGGAAHPVSPPILAYRVWPDGREELVRGLRFRAFNVRSLRDIEAAGDDSNVFDYLDNGAPFGLIGARPYSAESTVVAPSVLIDDLDLKKSEDELPKLPIVPPPPLDLK